MSRTDLFARYTQLYQKTRAREIVPEGPLVRQLADVNTLGLDVGLFFKAKRKKPVQVYIGNPLPFEAAEEEGFLESDTDTYFSRSLLSDFRTIQYIRVVVSAGMVLEAYNERVEFLKKCQRILDVFLRKTRNVVHIGDFAPLRFDKRVHTLSEFLKKTLRMDEIGVEAAMIPFNMANPRYITLTGNDIIVAGEEPIIPHDVFQFVGGIGYTFDKKVGAVNEEQLFRTNIDLTQYGMDKAFIETKISQITEDFQTNVHSLIFSDIWKKSTAKPVGINFGGDILVKAESSSEILMGVFEVYLKPPTT